MPLVITSAPEVFEYCMHELIKGLQVIKVVADEFVDVGFGNTQAETICDHDQKLEAFLHS